VGVTRLQPVCATSPDGVSSKDLCPVSQLTASHVTAPSGPLPSSSLPLSDFTFQEHLSLAAAAAEGMMTAGACGVQGGLCFPERRALKCSYSAVDKCQ